MSLLSNTTTGSKDFPDKGLAATAIERRLVELHDQVTPHLYGAFSVHALTDSDTFMLESRRLGDVAFDIFKRINTLFTAMEPAAGAIADDVMK